MCLAIVKKPRVVIPESHLKEGWNHNPNGGGYAFVKDGAVQTRNGFMKYKDFAASYAEDFADNPDSVFLLHFRITSQGDSSADNTHPFPIMGGAMIHNGTLTGTGSKYGVGPSDTKLFAERYSAVLSYDFVIDNKFKLNEAIRGSKVCLLYDDGKYAIINEADGKWEDDVWYSNYSYRTYTGLSSCLIDLEE